MLETKTTSNGRQPQNIKVEYLSNHLSDFPQILNLSLGDPTKIKNPQKEDDLQWKNNLKILNVEYLSNHLPDLSIGN